MSLLRFYFIVLLIALPLGWFFPHYFSFLANHSTLILGAIIFLGALKIEKEDIVQVFRSKKTIFIFNLLMLVGLPLVVFVLAKIFVPEYIIPLLLLAAMPTGMATPLLAQIVGGRESLSMAMTVTTSLLAPFTIPAVLFVLIGVHVEVDFWEMFLSIAEIIFIPFLLAWITRRFFHQAVMKVKVGFGRLSTILLGLLIAGIVAQQSGALVESLLSFSFIISLGVVTLLMASFYVLGYFVYIHQNGKDRITLTVSFANMNFTLAIFLAHKYFENSGAVVPITLAVIPWFFFIVIFTYFTRKSVRDNIA